MLVERGEYVRYNYIDPKPGKVFEKGKRSIMLRNTDGKCEHLSIIPMFENKSLIITLKSETQEMIQKKVWNKKRIVRKKYLDLNL